MRELNEIGQGLYTKKLSKFVVKIAILTNGHLQEWIMHQKHGSSEDLLFSSGASLRMTHEAFDYGVHLSVHKQMP